MRWPLFWRRRTPLRPPKPTPVERRALDAMGELRQAIDARRAAQPRPAREPVTALIRGERGR